MNISRSGNESDDKQRGSHKLASQNFMESLQIAKTETGLTK
jgi:hypothetical protein